jgi:WD40 repeat protein
MGLAELHPDPAELERFSRGEISQEQRAALESHLAVCSECQARVDAVADDSLVALLRRAHARLGSRPGTSTSETLSLIATPLAASQVGTTCVDSCPDGLADHPRYRVLRLIGRGGMGAVYEATHRLMNRSVALKVINPAFTSNPVAVERFRREVRAAARLSHPNIAAALDAEEVNGTHFLVMEFVEGVSLARLVKENGALSVADACDCVRQTALGLQHAHQQGIVHRDIKPDNLIRRPDGQIKIVDFGLAALRVDCEDGVTAEQAVMGTPDFMAPEQAEDARRADVRSDVYSLGCTLFYLLAKQVPYPAETPMQKILAHRERPLPAITEFRSDVPPGLVQVLGRLLGKRPEERYATPAEVAEALRPFAQPEPQPERPRRRRALGIALAALVLVGVAAAGAIYRIQTDRGELIISTESDDVEVIVKRGGAVVQIIDVKTQKQITLRSGSYELELNGAEGLKLDIEQATLKRGETVVARIERRPAPAPAPVVAPAPATVQPTRPSPPAGAEPVALQRLWLNTDEGAHRIRFSPDGKRFLASSIGNTTRIFNAMTGEVLFTVPGVIGSFSPDGASIWAVDEARLRSIRQFDARTGKLIREFGEHEGYMYGLEISWNGKMLLTDTSLGTTHLWNLQTEKEIKQWNSDALRPIGFAGDGRLICMDRGNVMAGFWDIEKNELTTEWRGFKGFLHVSFPPNATQIPAVVAGKFQTYDSRTKQLVQEFSLGDQLEHLTGNGVALSHDGSSIASMTADWCKVWDARTGAVIGRGALALSADRNGHRATLSADGRLMAVCDADLIFVFRIPKMIENGKR